MKVKISEKTINKWKQSPEAIKDDLCVKIGSYMRKNNVSREVAIKKLGCIDPLTLK